MSDFLMKPRTAFQGMNRIAQGPVAEVALAVKGAMQVAPDASFLTFDDATGGVVDLDLRGTPAEIVARLEQRAEAADPPTVRSRGRPKLGVIAREVTLLPRHWDWLAQQPSGASQALRRLVDDARRGDGGRSGVREAQSAAYKFMSAMAGNLAGFEEATRALFANDRDGFVNYTQGWPEDVHAYALSLMTNRPAALP